MAEDPADVQFDRAEYAGDAEDKPRCAACKTALWSSYYAVNGKTVCEKCKTDLELSRGEGSGIGRFLRASLYGFGAGLVGAGIWYGIRAATGLEIGFIAIVVGLMVGGAVRKGSNGRGGWRYQALAMFLTYGSIVSTYIPMIIGQFRQDWSQKEEAKKHAAAPNASASAAPATAAPATAPAPAVNASAAAAGPAVHASPAPGVSAGAAEAPPTLGQALVSVVVFVGIVVAIAFAAPFLMGFQHIIGLFIIAIGLYEAWKINRQVPLEITGPHDVGSRAAPPRSADGG